ncbi:MAG: hypothetical protein R3D02_03210 [Hyphomicrobiales bacterium]
MRRHVPLAAPLALALAVLLGLGFAGAAERWTRYENARYGYAIDVPVDLFAMGPAPENNDGRDFDGVDGASHLAVWGSFNALELSVEGYADFLADDPDTTVTYRVVRDHWLVLSGYRRGDFAGGGERIFYTKAVFSGDLSTVSHFDMTYAKAAKRRFDPVIRRLSESLTAPAGD